MTCVADILQLSIDTCRHEYGAPRRLLVAFSGGRDSTVLLHLLAADPELGALVEAVHVNHRMQDGAAAWEKHCRQVARKLRVPFHALAVSVDARDGPEADARRVRYAALSAIMQAGDWLLTAHHEDDQAETLLLNLMRGSGVEGLRGAALYRELPPGMLLRPLLPASASAIAAWAAEHELDWIEDASNSDEALDRNYLRHSVLPALRARWPAVAAQMARTAGYAGDAARLCRDLAQLDVVVCGQLQRLATQELLKLSDIRRANLLRHACRELGLPAPTRRALAAIDNQLLPARADGEPCVAWGKAEARRYRDHLYLLEQQAPLDAPAGLLRPDAPVCVGSGMLHLQRDDEGGIDPALAEAGLSVRLRAGGERLQRAGHARSRTVKKLLQDKGVVPWMRRRIPLLYGGDCLVAVGDLWVASACYNAPGYRVRWDNRPALF